MKPDYPFKIERYVSSDAARYHFKQEEAIRGDLSCGSRGSVTRRQSFDLMASNRKKLQEETRFRVLRLLHENPELSTRDIADAVGISNGSAFYCISALAEKGLIKLGNFAASDHKGRYAYILTPKGVSEKAALTRRFLRNKMAEYEALKAEIEALKEESGLDPDRASEPKPRGR